MNRKIIAAAAAAFLCTVTAAGAAVHLKPGTYVAEEEFSSFYLLGMDGRGLCYDVVPLDMPIQTNDEDGGIVAYQTAMPMKWHEKAGKVFIECKNGKQSFRESYTIKSSKAFGDFVLEEN